MRLFLSFQGHSSESSIVLPCGKDRQTVADILKEAVKRHPDGSSSKIPPVESYDLRLRLNNHLLTPSDRIEDVLHDGDCVVLGNLYILTFIYKTEAFLSKHFLLCICSQERSLRVPERFIWHGDTALFQVSFYFYPIAMHNMS